MKILQRNKSSNLTLYILLVKEPRERLNRSPFYPQTNSLPHHHHHHPSIRRTHESPFAAGHRTSAGWLQYHLCYFVEGLKTCLRKIGLIRWQKKVGHNRSREAVRKSAHKYKYLQWLELQFYSGASHQHSRHESIKYQKPPECVCSASHSTSKLIWTFINM